MRVRVCACVVVPARQCIGVPACLPFCLWLGPGLRISCGVGAFPLSIPTPCFLNHPNNPPPPQNHSTFNITNDFTPEEEAQVREENRWCEEV